MLPVSTKDSIRSLRLRGLTYAEINSSLGLNLPKSTLSTLCKGILLSEENKTRIKRATLKQLSASRGKALTATKEKRKKYFDDLGVKYAQLRNHLEKSPDASLVALALLYLTEGSKQSGRLTFGNSDPKIIQLFLKLLNRCFVIDKSKFRCTVQCRADQDQPSLENFWSKVTNISKENFYKTRIDNRTVGKTTKKEGYMGVCRIDYFSGYIYNELQVIISLIT